METDTEEHSSISLSILHYFLDTEIPSLLVFHLLPLGNLVALSVATGLPFSACIPYTGILRLHTENWDSPWTRDGKFISLSSQFSLFFLSLGCLPVYAFTSRHRVIISLQWRHFFSTPVCWFIVPSILSIVHLIKNNNCNQSGLGHVPGIGQLFYIQYM